MTSFCLPIDADPATLTPAFAAQINRAAFAVLLAPVAGDPFGARSGIRPGAEPAVSITAGRVYTVGAFCAVVNIGGNKGPYLAGFTGSQTGTASAPDNTNPRTDRLDIQVPDDPPTGGRIPVLVYTAGTPGAGSPPPPAAPTRSTPVALINVPQVGGGNPTITVVPQYAVAAGGIQPIGSAANLPASGLHKGDARYTDSGLYIWNGTGWDLQAKSARIGQTVSLSDAWGTAAVRQHAGTWSYQESKGGFTSGATTTNPTPIVIPPGAGGLYAVSMTCGDYGGTNITAVGYALMNLTGTLSGSARSDYGVEIVAGRGALAAASATVPLADGATVGLTTSLTPASSNFKATLSCYRIGP